MQYDYDHIFNHRFNATQATASNLNIEINQLELFLLWGPSIIFKVQFSGLCETFPYLNYFHVKNVVPLLSTRSLFCLVEVLLVFQIPPFCIMFTSFHVYLCCLNADFCLHLCRVEERKVLST